MPQRLRSAAILAAGVAAASVPASAQDSWSREGLQKSLEFTDRRETEPRTCLDVDAKAGFVKVTAPPGTVFYKADVSWAGQWSAGRGWPSTGSGGYQGAEDRKRPAGLFSNLGSQTDDPAKRGPKRPFTEGAPYGALLMWANKTFVFMERPHDFQAQYAVPKGGSDVVYFGVNEAEDQLSDNFGSLDVCVFYRPR